MDTFDPSPCPDFARPKHVSMRVKRAGFGDGYSQRWPDGLNNVRRQLRLSWSKLTVAQADTIEAFFLAQEGAQPFLYAGTRDGVARQYSLTDYDRVELALPGFDSMQAVLSEEFDPV